MDKFTWINTYKEISNWLLTKKNKQQYLIEILKKIGVEGFKDVNEDKEEFQLNEIDPFSFFSYLNKYKLDSKRIEILQNIHSELKFKCEVPKDVLGIPTSHPLKVRLFPYKYARKNNEIEKLWNLFEQVITKKIDNDLFQKVLEIKSVGKGKISISFFYSMPDYYFPLDSKTTSYLRKTKLKYSFSTISEYLSLVEETTKALKLTPFEISYKAFLSQDNSNTDKLRIGSVRTLLDILDKLNDDSYNENVSIFYRGHSNSKFELKPSIYRNKELIKNENRLFKDIIARSPSDFKDCNSTFEKLVKMQHYSLPTRLLDITSNPLVALFFACKDETQMNEDGELYRFEIKEDELKYYDSDTVSVVSNIARRPHDFSIQSIKGLANSTFNKKSEIQYLLHEIRSEKPHFSAVIDSKHIEMVFCVKPKLDNPRIIRQEGAFFIFGISDDKTQCAKFDFIFESYIISKSEKQKMLNQLEALGINESTLFPEIDHVAKHLKDKYFKITI